MKLNFTDNEKHMLVEHLMRSPHFKKLVEKTTENEIKKLKYDVGFLTMLTKELIKTMKLEGK